LPVSLMTVDRGSAPMRLATSSPHTVVMRRMGTVVSTAASCLRTNSLVEVAVRSESSCVNSRVYESGRVVHSRMVHFPSKVPMSAESSKTGIPV